MCFLVDESTGQAVTAYLRRAGHDVMAVAESLPQADDITVLQLAARESRILITNDKDFGDLVHRQLSNLTKLACAVIIGGMKKQHVQLSPTDRETLSDLLSHGQQPVKVYRRALALLELDRGKTYTAVAETLGVCHQTLATLSARYRAVGLACLNDAPRSGRPPVLDGTQRAQITALACSTPPTGHARWTLRLLADKCVELGLCDTISHTEVSTILKKMNCVPISNAPGALGLATANS